MGLLTVEKCLFYLAVKTLKYKRPKVDIDDEKGGVRASLEIRTMRLPWEGGIEKTIGYLHDQEIHSGNRAVGTTETRLREYLLGTDSGSSVWKHPNVIVASVPKPEALMTGTKLGNILLARLKASGGIASGVTPHQVKPRRGELWLPWDPTQPGKRFASTTTTHRLASAMLDKPIGEVYAHRVRGRKVVSTKYTDRFGNEKTRYSEGSKDSDYNAGVYTILGTGFRLAHYEFAPAGVVWNERITRRIRDHMSSSGVPDGMEWYGIGEFIPDDHLPDRLIRRYREKGVGYQTYAPGRGVIRNDPSEDRVLRRIGKVTARNHEDAQREMQRKLDRAKMSAHRLEAIRKETAWSRTGNKVVTASVWDTSYRSRASGKRRSFISKRVSLPLREEFSRRVPTNRVY
ncbi:MAG: hypothetical protein JRC86_07575 [Deltaproteobacteria bacterium]|nr:hypothetical protein [Deltaproteobacteria bacterium]